MTRVLRVSALSVALLCAAAPILADDQDRAQDRDRMENRDMDQERIYGSQLMTPAERDEYRARLRAATTAEERDRIRAEHHEQMKLRAKERGVTLPDEPRGWDESGAGRGMGPGMHPGSMGSGGMGSGGGKDR